MTESVRLASIACPNELRLGRREENAEDETNDEVNERDEARDRPLAAAMDGIEPRWLGFDQTTVLPFVLLPSQARPRSW